MATNGPAGSGRFQAQPIPEDLLLSDPDDRLTADEAHVDQQVLAMLPHSVRAELNMLAQGVPVAAFPIDLDDEETTVDAAVLAGLTPALRVELDKLRRGEPVKGTAIDPDAELAKHGRNIDL
jgi:hypothetical protein